MSDDYDDDDELPPISVNSSTRESDVLSMPSAEELASQRAREAECERELEQLRAQHDGDIAMTTDSSGSEGEAALAAAVSALIVRSSGPTITFPSIGTLLQDLLPKLPIGEAQALLQADAEVLEALTDDVCGAVRCGRVRTADEVTAALCWLLAAAATAPTATTAPGGGRARRRALLLLLEDATLTQEAVWGVSGVSALMSRALPSAAARLRAADALTPALPRSPAARRLHAELLAAALHRPPPTTMEECLCAWAGSAASAPWRRAGGVTAAGGAWAVRAAGRVLRACRARHHGVDGAARARLLHALAAPPPAADRLEVLVGASKLQLLFRD